MLGKLAASLCPLAELMIGSLPIVMLCLPLGGVSFFEVLAAYLAMISSVALFAMISLWCSSYFTRTSASLVVSYLMILPLAMVGVFVWQALEQLGEARLLVVFTVVPIACLSLGALLLADICRRLLHPPDLGSGGKQAIDLETEAEAAVGLYIERDEFPDRLFAPPKRTTFLPEDANPIYDKEIRSEIFSQGTLMLRLVIQISMGLALPLMAVLPVLKPQLRAVVHRLRAAVQHARRPGVHGRQRHQRTRTANARPAAHHAHHALANDVGQTALGLARVERAHRLSHVARGARVHHAARLLVATCRRWPATFWSSALTCVTTAMTALFCSTLFPKTSTSLLATYLIIITLFLVPLAAERFVEFFVETPTAPGSRRSRRHHQPVRRGVQSAARSLELARNRAPVSLPVFWGHLFFAVVYNAVLLLGDHVAVPSPLASFG